MLKVREKKLLMLQFKTVRWRRSGRNQYYIDHQMIDSPNGFAVKVEKIHNISDFATIRYVD